MHVLLCPLTTEETDVEKTCDQCGGDGLYCDFDGVEPCSWCDKGRELLQKEKDDNAARALARARKLVAEADAAVAK